MINQKVHKLLEDNRYLFGGMPISFDGVVDEESYLASRVRTAFLLKDINGIEIKEENGIKVEKMMDTDWEYMNDLRKDILNPNKSLYKTWPNACLWLELLKNPNTTYASCITENEEFDQSRLRYNMLAVSIINLKKTPGRGSSNHDEILNAIDYGAQMIKEEIDIVDPQLIICGGTFHYAVRLFNVSKDEQKMLPSGAHYFVVDKRVYVEFVHPIWYSVNRRILFSYAKSVLPEIMKVVDEQNNR